MLEVRHVVAPYLDEPAPLELSQRVDDSSTAEVHRAKALRRVFAFLDVERVQPPAVVELALRVIDDRRNSGGNLRGVPNGARGRLVRLGREQHAAILLRAGTSSRRGFSSLQ